VLAEEEDHKGKDQTETDREGERDDGHGGNGLKIGQWNRRANLSAVAGGLLRRGCPPLCISCDAVGNSLQDMR
jgi:hypothetical protein